MIEHLVIVKGRVQGVGFRAAVKKLADSYNLYGWIKNLENDDVLICLQTDETTLDEFLKNLKQHPGRATIREFSIQKTNSLKNFSSFEIL